MSITLNGSGGLFGRLGAIWGFLADVYALQGATATSRVLAGASAQTRITTLDTDYAASPVESSLLAADNGFGQSTGISLNQIINNWSNVSTLFSQFQAIAQNTLIKTCDLDAGGLPQRTLNAALTYLINQMTSGLAAPVQTAPSTANSGGTIANGTYYYVITATTDLGETVASNEENITTTGTNISTVTLNWNAVTNATGYKIYRGTSSGAENLLIKTVSGGATVTYIETGSESTTSATPPTTGTASTSVNATTVSVGAQTKSGVPNGNPIIVVSGLNGKGQTHQYGYNETLTFTVSSDAQTGGATLGQEALTIQGQVAVTDKTSYSWPAGSGVNVTINATDSQVNNSGANPNVLQNSSFETFTTASNPDNWTIATGTAGTQVISGGSANSYKGGNSVGFVGDSSTLTAITQIFNTTPTTTVGAGGTSYKALPATPYAVNGWVKMSAGSPGAGVLEIALTDGSGTIQNDASGNACSTTVALTGISDTNWHNFNAVFRLPLVLPTQVKLRIRLSTALSAGKTVYIDAVSMNPMTQLYTGGPYVSVFSGSTAMVLNDAWTVSYGVTWGSVQQWLQRFFSISSLGMRMPASSAGSPTVADTVIA